MKKLVNPFDYAGVFGESMKKGILLTAKDGDFVNTMTIGWGTLGIEWSRPVFVACNEQDVVCGYCFCIFQREENNNVLTDIKTLYIDDLCVDSKLRGQHIGKSLYNYVLDFAKKEGCYNVTLNVWSGNGSALRFYESLGMKPQKVGMEAIL